MTIWAAKNPHMTRRMSCTGWDIKHTKTSLTMAAWVWPKRAEGASGDPIINYFGVTIMTLFKCTLIKNGYIQERFYREGDSEFDLLEGLEIFNWGDGSWEIVEVSA